MMEPEKKLTSQRVYEGRGVSMRVDTVEVSGGKEATREVVEHSDGVAVVVVDECGDVILVRQYRHAVGRFLLEVPAGGIDTAEEPADTVRRELQEEIGYLPRNIDRLGGFYPIPGYGTEYLHCFLATNLVASRLVAEDTDSIELVRVPSEDIPGLITSGEICDAKSAAALLLFLWIQRRNATTP